ncbi:Zinc finger, RING/FYVE/PHD-type [Phytophthora cactorum]|nr:Zinc finger, RING/FYVE/PHD-type [Phytophthora cactorum]
MEIRRPKAMAPLVETAERMEGAEAMKTTAAEAASEAKVTTKAKDTPVAQLTAPNTEVAEVEEVMADVVTAIARKIQTRGQQRHPSLHMAQFLDLAEETKAVLLELGAILNQRYRNRGPSHQTQRSLQRKNEAVSRLEQFIIDQRRVCEREEELNKLAEKQLEDQQADFDQERERLQQQATSTLTAQADLNSSLTKVLPQLRGLLDAFDREQGQHLDLRRDTTTRTVTITGETSFGATSDAAKTQQDISHRNLTEREAALTCPISLDLFENPVLTTCCGKTFSSEALTQALRRNPHCPVCRAHRVSTHANRDVANLVELHRSERSLLGLPENAAATSSTIAPNVDERSMVTERPTVASGGGGILMTSAARENQNRNSRNQRVQARAAVPHRQSSATTAQSDVSPNETLPSTGVNSRGRRRRGRNSSSRRRRTYVQVLHQRQLPHLKRLSALGSSSSSLLSAVQSPSWGQSWGSSNGASQSSTAGSGASGNALTRAYGSTAATYSKPRSSLDSYYQQRSNSNPTPAQSSRSTRYGWAHADEFNFHPSCSKLPSGKRLQLKEAATNYLQQQLNEALGAYRAQRQRADQLQLESGSKAEREQALREHIQRQEQQIREQQAALSECTSRSFEQQKIHERLQSSAELLEMRREDENVKEEMPLCRTIPMKARPDD